MIIWRKASSKERDAAQISYVPVTTNVPGRENIELVASYKDFHDYYQNCEIETKSWFVNNIQPDWVCVDAGANVGYHSILMAAVAYDGCVYSFEPTETFELLEKNLSHNNSQNVRALRKGLASRDFVGAEAVTKIWGAKPVTREFSFVTLDTFSSDENLTRLDLIKIDTDGYDLEILWGAEKSINKFKPTIVIELNEGLKSRGAFPSDAMRWLVNLGYTRALCLDSENFLFTYVGPSHHHGTELTISLDHNYGSPFIEPSFTIPAWDPRETNHSACKALNGTAISEAGVFTQQAPAWNYVAYIPRDQFPQDSVYLFVKVNEGKLGILQSDEAGKEILTAEIFVPEKKSGLIQISLDPRCTQLIFRKASEQNLSFQLNP